MQTLAIASIALAATLACPVGARAADTALLSRFRAFCVSTEADPARAVAAAEAAGWKAPAGDARADVTEVRAGRDADGQWELIVDQKSPRLAEPPVPMRVCRVSLAAPGSETLQAQVHAWLGIEPYRLNFETLMYTYLEKDGRKQFLGDPDRTKALAAVRDGTMRTVLVTESQSMTQLSYAVPVPQAR
jgi:hypothetical protein